MPWVRGRLFGLRLRTEWTRAAPAKITFRGEGCRNQTRLNFSMFVMPASAIGMDAR